MTLYSSSKYRECVNVKRTIDKYFKTLIKTEVRRYIILTEIIFMQSYNIISYFSVLYNENLTDK